MSDLHHEVTCKEYLMLCWSHNVARLKFVFACVSDIVTTTI